MRIYLDLWHGMLELAYLVALEYSYQDSRSNPGVFRNRCVVAYDEVTNVVYQLQIIHINKMWLEVSLVNDYILFLFYEDSIMICLLLFYFHSSPTLSPVKSFYLGSVQNTLAKLQVFLFRS